MDADDNLKNANLGKKVIYEDTYNPNLLFPVPRNNKRIEIGIDPNKLPFKGYDCWNHYEVSWLNSRGKPVVAVAEIYYDCSTSNIIESKSLKLYFNSFNNTKFNNSAELENIIKQDLSKCVVGDVIVRIYELSKSLENLIKIHHKLDGVCIDNLDIECTEYTVKPEYLILDKKLNQDNNIITEILYSDLLKSNCLVTNQPDWGSIQINYTGSKINHENLLKYIVSFRNHNEFHEQCIERIFNDIMQYCKPIELTIIGRYTRRGGLDINPVRTNKSTDIDLLNYRLIRQ